MIPFRLSDRNSGFKIIHRIASPLSVLVALSVSALAEDSVDFAREVRPILARHCFACHGPDQAQRKAELRLDTKEGAFSDLGGYAPVVAGKVDDSEIMARIMSEDADEVMPPGGPEKRLKPEEVATLKRWIAQGATWKNHWAFEPPVKAALPTVKSPEKAKSPIDRFVLAR